VKSFLLDPILFGNRDNLVNGDTPFKKFIVENPTDCKEYLASQHYELHFAPNPAPSFLCNHHMIQPSGMNLLAIITYRTPYMVAIQQ